jgi:hypothetical protein
MKSLCDRPVFGSALASHGTSAGWKRDEGVRSPYHRDGFTLAEAESPGDDTERSD